MAEARGGEFLNATRARGWIALSAAMTVAALIAALALSHDGLDPSGRPLGTDFVSFWTAARLALSDGAAVVWDGMRLEAAERAVFPAIEGFYAFFYPPVFLLVCLPFGLLGHVAALVAWLGLTAVAAWRGLAMLACGAFGERWGAIAFLGQPAVFVVAGHGQNAFLSTALFAFGAAFAERRPVVAGIALGLLVYKPQLALLLPFALAAAGAWRLFVATALSAAGWCLLSLAIFGLEAWRAFFAMSRIAGATLEAGLVAPEKMASLFAGLRVLGASTALAGAVQAIATVVVIVAAVVALRRARRRDGAGEAAVVVTAAGALLATPFGLDYDAAILAVPLVFLVRAVGEGLGSLERWAMLAALVAPVAARPIAFAIHLPLAPLAFAALFVVVVGRVAAAEAAIRPRPRSGSTASSA